MPDRRGPLRSRHPCPGSGPPPRPHTAKFLGRDGPVLGLPVVENPAAPLQLEPGLDGSTHESREALPLACGASRRSASSGWNDMARSYRGMTVLPIPESDPVFSQVTAGIEFWH